MRSKRVYHGRNGRLPEERDEECADHQCHNNHRHSGPQASAAIPERMANVIAIDTRRIGLPIIRNMSAVAAMTARKFCTRDSDQEPRVDRDDEEFRNVRGLGRKQLRSDPPDHIHVTLVAVIDRICSPICPRPKRVANVPNYPRDLKYRADDN